MNDKIVLSKRIRNWHRNHVKASDGVDGPDRSMARAWMKNKGIRP